MTFQIQKPSPVRFGDVKPWNLEGATKPTPKPPASPRFGDIDWTEFYGQRVVRTFNGQHQAKRSPGEYELESFVPQSSKPNRLARLVAGLRGFLSKSTH